MTTDTVLTQKQIDQLEAVTLTAHAQYIGAGEVHIDGANEFARAIEQAVLQSEQVQELYGLLKEARQQLPLAAACWNEDDKPERGKRNLAHVMELIAKIDAAMQEQKP